MRVSFSIRFAQLLGSIVVTNYSERLLDIDMRDRNTFRKNFYAEIANIRRGERRCYQLARRRPADQWELGISVPR